MPQPIFSATLIRARHRHPPNPTEDLRSQLSSLETSRAAAAGERDEVAESLRQLVGWVEELGELVSEGEELQLPAAAAGAAAGAGGAAAGGAVEVPAGAAVGVGGGRGLEEAEWEAEQEEEEEKEEEEMGKKEEDWRGVGLRLCTVNSMVTRAVLCRVVRGLCRAVLGYVVVCAHVCVRAVHSSWLGAPESGSALGGSCGGSLGLKVFTHFPRAWGYVFPYTAIPPALPSLTCLTGKHLPLRLRLPLPLLLALRLRRLRGCRPAGGSALHHAGRLLRPGGGAAGAGRVEGREQRTGGPGRGVGGGLAGLGTRVLGHWGTGAVGYRGTGALGQWGCGVLGHWGTGALGQK